MNQISHPVWHERSWTSVPASIEYATRSVAASVQEDQKGLICQPRWSGPRSDGEDHRDVPTTITTRARGVLLSRPQDCELGAEWWPGRGSPVSQRALSHTRCFRTRIMCPKMPSGEHSRRVTRGTSIVTCGAPVSELRPSSMTTLMGDPQTHCLFWPSRFTLRLLIEAHVERASDESPPRPAGRN
jgi:hypothetical protein